MQYTSWQRTALTLAASVLLIGTAAQARIEVSSIPGFPGPRDVNKTPIEATSFQWGAVFDVRTGPGTRVVGAPALSELTWTQGFDSTYIALNKSMFGYEDFDSTFSFYNNRPGEASSSYLTMKTTGSALSGLSITSDGDRPTVSASEAFGSFELTYDPTALGQTGSKVTAGYNGITQTASGDTSRSGPEPAGTGARASGLYLRLGSGRDLIAGDSTDAGYENWIKLDSFQMGMGIRLTPDGESFSRSVPSVSEVTVTQAFDGTVPVILSNLLRGRDIGQATIELVQIGAAGPATRMQLALDGVIFSGLALGSEGDRPSVGVSMNMTGFTQTAWALKNDGTLGDAETFSYDILNGEVIKLAKPASFVSGFGAGTLAPVSAAPIPEPQTWALMFGGIAMLAGLRRRRAA